MQGGLGEKPAGSVKASKEGSAIIIAGGTKRKRFRYEKLSMDKMIGLNAHWLYWMNLMLAAYLTQKISKQSIVSGVGAIGSPNTELDVVKGEER